MSSTLEATCTALESCTCANHANSLMQKPKTAMAMAATAAPVEPSLGVMISEDLQSQGMENPLLKGKNMPQLSEKEKIAKIEGNFKNIMETMGMDLTDASITKTPHRVAKMYVKELCSGLVPENFPACTTFPVAQNSVVFQRDIPFTSMCEHHFLLFTGVAHVGYFSNGKVIGLSKLNRIVEYFARRPQIQERLNKQILRCLQKVLDTEHVVVKLEAAHSCIAARGALSKGSCTSTVEAGGMFMDEAKLREYLPRL
jgi:GTP cyclohydrolase IA